MADQAKGRGGPNENKRKRINQVADHLKIKKKNKKKKKKSSGGPNKK